MILILMSLLIFFISIIFITYTFKKILCQRFNAIFCFRKCVLGLKINSLTQVKIIHMWAIATIKLFCL